MPRKATIPIYDGDDFERLAELRREVDIAERNAQSDQGASPRIGDDVDTSAEVRRARQAFAAAVDEASERAEMWVLHPIGHEEFRQLLRDHPPRKVKETGEDGQEREVAHADDSGWDVNAETFPKALLTFVDPDDETIRTVAQPEFDSVAALRKRIKRLSVGEFDSIWVAAFVLNNGGIADPKASPYYDGVPRSDET